MGADASAELRALAARLKTAGNGADLRLQLMRGLRAGAAPLQVDVRRAALAQLPKSGGLNVQVAGQKVSVSVRPATRTADVRLTTTAPDTYQTDHGWVRHPTFGRRGPGDWKDQKIPAATGWWSKTLAKDQGKVTPELLAIMRAIANEIQGV